MAQKLLKRTPRKVAPTDAGNMKRGTGNGRQHARSLASRPFDTWIEWHSCFNYDDKTQENR